MTDLKAFIDKARKNGLNDEQIRKALVSQGWDEAMIDPTLMGLEVPKVDKSPSNTHAKQPSLSPLMAALHHVFLWFFTVSSTVAIIGVVASLSGFDISSKALASMIAVTLVTFTPYAILYIIYLRQSRRTPGLIPGKVWSIITICLHSIAAMISAITLVVATIVSSEQNTLISAALVLLLDLIVVTTYGFAAFGSARLAVAKITTLIYLPVLFVLLGTLFTLSLVQLGPVRHDEQLRKDLVSTVEAVNAYARSNNSLPTSSSDVTSNPAITYEPITDATYKVCGTFKVDSKKATNNNLPTRPRSDRFVSTSQFDDVTSGNHCFEFSSETLSGSRR
jgi:hypothetical protein